MQIHWAAGRGAVRDATTGRIVGSGAPTLPFEHDDLYDAEKRKHIAPRFAHLPRPQTLALIQGLLETDGNVSRGKEITFTQYFSTAFEGLRYQLLRLGVPTAGNSACATMTTQANDPMDLLAEFKGETNRYDLRIPAVTEIAERVGCKPLDQTQLAHTCNALFLPASKTVKAIAATPFVCDLKVEDDESYMTTSALPTTAANAKERCALTWRHGTRHRRLPRAAKKYR